MAGGLIFGMILWSDVRGRADSGRSNDCLCSLFASGVGDIVSGFASNTSSELAFKFSCLEFRTCIISEIPKLLAQRLCYRIQNIKCQVTVRPQFC
jgi:hypothetical protein